MPRLRYAMLALAAPALLQAQTVETSGRTSPRLQEYRLDAGHSIIEFSVGFAFSRVKGRFTNAVGTILYDSLQPAQSSITIVIDSKSLDTGWPHRDEHLRTSDFFDVEKFPTIVFQSDRLRQTDGGWLADGNLTMHGVTKPVTIPFRFPRPPTRSPESYWMIFVAEGNLRLSRSDFGIFGGSTFNSWFNKARAATMADSVDISLEIEGWNADAQSQRMPIEAALERIKTGGVQTWIDRLDSVRKVLPAERFQAYFTGADFITRALLATGRVDDALTLSRALTEFYPSAPRAYVLNGVALSFRGDTRGAAKQYAKAIEVFRPRVVDPNEKFPQDDEQWTYLDQVVRTLLEWDRPAVAVPVARAVVTMYPSIARAQTTLGVALGASGDAKGAAASYAKALEIDSRETRALEYRRRTR
jgi:polyisoprenoid-binding protein YceI